MGAPATVHQRTRRTAFAPERTKALDRVQRVFEPGAEVAGRQGNRSEVHGHRRRPAVITALGCQLPDLREPGTGAVEVAPLCRDNCRGAQRIRQPPLVPSLLGELVELLDQGLGSLKVSLVRGDVDRSPEDVLPRFERRRSSFDRERQPHACLAVEAARQPVVRERRREAQQRLVLVQIACPLERCPQVVVLGFDASGVVAGGDAGIGAARLLGDVEKVSGMPSLGLASRPALREALARVLADRLQHPEALVRVAERGSCRRATGACRCLRRRPPLRPRACSRRGTRRGARTGAAPRSSSRSWLHSIVARSVCWRGSASRPPLSRSSRCERRSRIWAGERTLVRAAASSSASGRSSRRRQSSAIVSSGSSCERAQKSSTASGSASGGTGYSTSPVTRRSSRLVTRSFRFGQASSSCASSGAASTTCSRLSSRSSSSRSPMCSARPSLRPERLRDRLGHERGVAQRSEADPEDAGLEGGHELGCGLEREPRLAGSTRPGKRDEARAVLKQDDELARAPAPCRRRRRPAAAGSCSRSSSAAGSARSRAGRARPARRSPSADARRALLAHRRRAPASPRETTTWPPWPAAAIRAARCSSRPA